MKFDEKDVWNGRNSIEDQKSAWMILRSTSIVTSSRGLSWNNLYFVVELCMLT